MENKKIYEKEVAYTVNDGSLKLDIYEKKDEWHKCEIHIEFLSKNVVKSEKLMEEIHDIFSHFYRISYNENVGRE